MLTRLLDIVFPFLAAVKVNLAISKEIKEMNQDKIAKKWFNKFSKSKVDEKSIEKMSHDIYQSQERRISNIENKAISLIVAIGFSISLLTIIIGFNESDLELFRIIAIIIFMIAIFILIIGAGSAILAYRIGKRRVASIDEFSEIIDKDKDNFFEWASKYLSAVEINIKLGLMKSNWVDVAQRHTLAGLILIFIGTLFVIGDVFYVPISVFEINLSENIEIIDSISLGHG